MKVIACNRCKEYLPIHFGNFVSQKLENDFRMKHKGHTVFMAELQDLSDYSKIVT